MIKQLLLCKRLMIEGASFAERHDPVSTGLAISLFQDSVEMFIWLLIKERGIKVKELSSFTVNIEELQKGGVQMAHTAKLFELNKARVGFKHYGNLPAAGEADVSSPVNCTLIHRDFGLLCLVPQAVFQRG